MPERPDMSTGELLNDAIESALLDVHVALPGTVVAYDATAHTADVKPGVRRKIDGEKEDHPIIKSVPVAWHGSTGHLMVFPLVPGDSVILLFSEADWATFRTTGQIATPGDLTRHSLSYPWAIPWARVPAPGAVGASIVAATPLSVGTPASALPTAWAQGLIALRTAVMADLAAAAIPTAALTALDAPPGTWAAFVTSTKLKAS